MVYLLSLSEPISLYPELRVFKYKRLGFFNRLNLLLHRSFGERRRFFRHGYVLVDFSTAHCYIYMVDLSEKKGWNESTNYKLFKEIFKEDLRDSKINKILG